MSKPLSQIGERGATLVVALIMLLLITLLVSGAFSLSMTNLKAVGNVQMREEALAAANKVVEDVISTSFVGAGSQSFSVDIDGDSNDDYLVQVPQPVCIKAVMADATAPSSVSLAVLSSSTWNTIWQVEANATDTSGQASVRVRTGVRVLLPDAQKNIHCGISTAP